MSAAADESAAPSAISGKPSGSGAWRLALARSVRSCSSLKNAGSRSRCRWARPYRVRDLRRERHRARRAQRSVSADATACPASCQVRIADSSVHCNFCGSAPFRGGTIRSMAHRRRPLARAFLLNTIVLVVELVGGVQASSLSLIVDGVHNLSDEMALGFLVLAYTLRQGLSGRLLRAANLFNSVGLMAISVVLFWQVVEGFSQPVPVLGVVPVVAGIVGAA